MVCLYDAANFNRSRGHKIKTFRLHVMCLLMTKSRIHSLNQRASFHSSSYLVVNFFRWGLNKTPTRKRKRHKKNYSIDSGSGISVENESLILICIRISNEWFMFSIYHFQRGIERAMCLFWSIQKLRTTQRTIGRGWRIQMKWNSIERFLMWRRRRRQTAS